jgi:chromosomal replication initiation ATPase DnaA
MRVDHLDVMPGYNPDFARAVRQKRESAERIKHANMLLREAARAKEEIEAKKAARDADPLHAVRAMIPRTEFQRIERRAALAFGIKLVEIRGPSRKRNIVLARQFICYWARRRTTLSLPQIGRRLGGRDHTTVLHAVRAYRDMRQDMGRKLPPAR